MVVRIRKEEDRLIIDPEGDIVWKVDSLERAQQFVDAHNNNYQVKSLRWDLSILSTEQLIYFKEICNLKQWSSIMGIHNDYKLSSAHYCCSKHVPIIEERLKELKEDGIL